MDAESHQYLTFVLGQDAFAIGILHIKEILEYGQPTTVPLMPEFIRGVINLRGSVVPVIDLAARFGRPATRPSRRTCIVIVESGTQQQDIGVIVDAVNEVVDIPPERIEPPPALGAGVSLEFMQGMGKVGEDGRFVIVLAADHVLSLDELVALGTMEDRTAEAVLA